MICNSHTMGSEFKKKTTNIADASSSGLSVEVTTVEMIGKIHKIVVEDPRLEASGISTDCWNIN